MIDFDTIAERLKAWEERSITFQETVCRAKRSDPEQLPYIATRRRFVMLLQSVETLLNGYRLTFRDKQAENVCQYEIALGCVKRMEFIDRDQLLGEEHFESQSVRQSILGVPNDA